MPRAAMSEPFRLGLHFQPIVRFVISTVAQRSGDYRRKPTGAANLIAAIDSSPIRMTKIYSIKQIVNRVTLPSL